MPNIILTDEELQEVDKLLAEHDPERHPETAPLLSVVNDDIRQTLCTWVRESQRTALDLAFGMKVVVDNSEAAGLKRETAEAHDPASNLEDGWLFLLNAAHKIHPLAAEANKIIDLFEDDAWLKFISLVTDPASEFSRVKELYESPSEVAANG